MTRRQLLRFGASAAVTAASPAPATVRDGDWHVHLPSWRSAPAWPVYLPALRFGGELLPLSAAAHHWVRLGARPYSEALAQMRRELAEMRANDWDAPL